MSPAMNMNAMTLGGFPRVSGDEPEAQQAATLALMFSPRERG